MVDTGPYPSPFGDSVMLFDPGMDMAGIQRTLDSLHRQQANDEFSLQRYALLFKPGEYELDITVDYYVQAAGLGQVPGDVRINGTVQSIASAPNNCVTIMFWRSAENFLVHPAGAHQVVHWAVSQAAPYRRMHIVGDLHFDLGGWASGGFLANSIVEGTAGLTSGQQWFTRNSDLGSWTGGNWNQTFVGSTGTPATAWPREPNTVVDRTPVVRDKPFLVLDESNRFSVFVPALNHNTRSVSWRSGAEGGTHLSIDDFHIAFPLKDSAASINAALKSGKQVLFTPGIYALDDAIHVRRPGTIVMGLGLATLVPQTGEAALITDDVAGITIAGLMVDAGPVTSPVLIQIGAPKQAADPLADHQGSHDHRDNPIVLHDVFCRVGGAAPGSAGTCLEINSHHVIVDHTWLWRADHGAGVRWDGNRADHGLIVNGDDVTVYALFNEHFQHYQTLWNGERGRVFFFQSEMPYDPPNQALWMAGDTMGYAAYKVADTVQAHQAWGLGIYSFFGVHSDADPRVRVRSAIEAPDNAGVCFKHISTFAGRSGGIDHPINLRGTATNAGQFRFFRGVNVDDCD